MLSPRELSQWFRTNRTTPKAREIIKGIRNLSDFHSAYCDQDPVRSYSSEKMGCPIRTTQHALYETAVILLEYDPDVLEYWPLIPTDTLAASKSRRFLREPVFPYFFVIRTTSAGWDQFEFEEQLDRLSRAKPRFLHKDEKGVWHQAEIERRAALLGLYSRVHSWLPIHSNFVAPVETQHQLPTFTTDSSQLVELAVRPARVLAKIAIERFFARKNAWFVRGYSSGDAFSDEDERAQYLM